MFSSTFIFYRISYCSLLFFGINFLIFFYSLFIKARFEWVFYIGKIRLWWWIFERPTKFRKPDFQFNFSKSKNSLLARQYNIQCDFKIRTLHFVQKSELSKSSVVFFFQKIEKSFLRGRKKERFCTRDVVWHT